MPVGVRFGGVARRSTIAGDPHGGMEFRTAHIVSSRYRYARVAASVPARSLKWSRHEGMSPSVCADTTAARSRIR